MHVRVHERRHHRLAGEIDPARTRGRRQGTLRTDLREASVLDDERGVLDRRAAIAGDQARALEERGRRALRRRRGIERLELDDRRAVVVAHPERHRRRVVVHEHAPHVRRTRQEILDDRAAHRIEAQDAVVVLAARPDVAVLVRRDVVRPGARRRDRPFLKALGPRVEHPDPIAVVLAEPQTILRVHHPAPRSGARRRRLEDLDLAALRVDPADVFGAEHEEVAVVARIRNHVVDVRPRNLVRLEHVEGAGGDVEPQHRVRAGVLQPDLAVHVGAIRADLVDLDVRSVSIRRQAPGLKRLACGDRTSRCRPETACRATRSRPCRSARRECRWARRASTSGSDTRRRVPSSDRGRRGSVRRSSRTTPAPRSRRSRRAAGACAAAGRTPCR